MNHPIPLSSGRTLTSLVEQVQEAADYEPLENDEELDR
jgi:hypothetical protein